MFDPPHECGCDMTEAEAADFLGISYDASPSFDGAGVGRPAFGGSAEPGTRFTI
jgi:hypothetical protein